MTAAEGTAKASVFIVHEETINSFMLTVSSEPEAEVLNTRLLHETTARNELSSPFRLEITNF